MTRPAPVLSVVIPVYNEADNIDPVVQKTTSALDETLPNAYEIVLVNDGSSDQSDRICMECTNKYPNTQVWRHDANQGLGAALKTGYLACTGEFVSFIPGDGEVEIDQVLKLLGRIGSDDMVITRRNRSVPFHREFLTAGWWFMMRLLFGFDTRSEGIYIIRRNLLLRIGLERIKSTTGLINIEIPMRAIREGCRWKHDVMDTRPRLSGESKVVNFSTTFRTLWETLKLRFTIPVERQPDSHPLPEGLAHAGENR
jgi:glycosyltransferase involved in cell wall biosynthesis